MSTPELKGLPAESPTGTVKVINGNQAAAWGCRLSRVDVVAAYPITPQTKVVEKIAEFVAEGEYTPEYIKVESEHSAMAACISATMAGARSFTATSSAGLALMHELLHWAPAMRTPMVLVNVNRAMGPPWSVWADHTDSISQRDTGFLQIFCEDNQEVLDTVIMAYKVSEKEHIRMPIMVTLDAFYLSHTHEPVNVPHQHLVDQFLPKFETETKLDVDNPKGFGSLSMPHQWYMELRYNMQVAAKEAGKLFLETEKEFEDIFGRSYGGMVDEYHTDDADVIFTCAGTMASTTRVVVDKLRAEGKKVGLARLRFLRPFPADVFAEIGRKCKYLATMERCISFGYEGPFATEIKAALYDVDDKPLFKNYYVGIGGRDVTPELIERLYLQSISELEAGKVQRLQEWVDLKGEEVE